MDIGVICGNCYDWAKVIYGKPLNEFLWGWNCDSEDFSNSNLYIEFVFATLILVGVIGSFYYYIIKPVRDQRMKWFLSLFIAVFLNFIYGFARVLYCLNNDLIGNCLVYADDGETLQISFWNCISFGIANALIIAIVYFFASLGMKQCSKTGKHYPF